MVVCGASSPGSMPRKAQYMDVYQWLKEHHGIDISYHTLHNRFLGKTVPC